MPMNPRSLWIMRAVNYTTTPPTLMFLRFFSNSWFCTCFAKAYIKRAWKFDAAWVETEHVRFASTRELSDLINKAISYDPPFPTNY